MHLHSAHARNLAYWINFLWNGIVSIGHISTRIGDDCVAVVLCHITQFQPMWVTFKFEYSMVPLIVSTLCYA